MGDDNKATIHPEDLVHEDFLLLGPQSYTRREILSVFDQAGVEPRIRAEIDLEELAVGLVASGAGVSIIDEYSARSRKAQGAKILYRPFQPTIEMDIHIFHNTNPRSPDLVGAVIEKFFA